jgi:hypothetical protein
MTAETPIQVWLRHRAPEALPGNRSWTIAEPFLNHGPGLERYLESGELGTPSELDVRCSEHE